MLINCELFVAREEIQTDLFSSWEVGLELYQISMMVEIDECFMADDGKENLIITSFQHGA